MLVVCILGVKGIVILMLILHQLCFFFFFSCFKYLVSTLDDAFAVVVLPVLICCYELFF